MDLKTVSDFCEHGLDFIASIDCGEAQVSWLRDLGEIKN